MLWPSRIKGLPPLSNLAKAPEGAADTTVFGHFANFANAEAGFEGFLSVVVYGKKWVYCAREYSPRVLIYVELISNTGCPMCPAASAQFQSAQADLGR